MIMEESSPTVEPGAPAVAPLADAVVSLSLQDASPIGSLPTELLRQILEKAVPPSLIIEFTKYQTAKMWRPKTKVTAYDLFTGEETRMGAYASLLGTCAKIARIAKAMLYGNNRFSFHTNLPLPNEKLTKLPYRFLREMKDIQLVLESSHKAAEHEQFLQNFVAVIRAHSQDTDRKAILKRLGVKILFNGEEVSSDLLLSHSAAHRNPRYGALWSVGNCMYTLETLVRLSRVDQVTISGSPLWLSQCLELCIQDGCGSSVPNLRWRTKKVKKTKKRAAYRTSTRMAGEPILDWTKFAQNHGIGLPEATLNRYIQQNTLYPPLSDGEW